MTIHDDMPTKAWPEEAAKLRQALHDTERQLQAHKGCDMTDRYWEGYRDGCADTRDRFLAKRDKEIERLRDENATLLERIDTEPAQWKAAYEQRYQLLQDALDERDRLRMENDRLRLAVCKRKGDQA